MLKMLAHNKYINLLSGIVLLCTSSYEIFTEIGEASIGVRHGVFIFAIAHILDKIPEFNVAIKEFDEFKK